MSGNIGHEVRWSMQSKKWNLSEICAPNWCTPFH